MNRNAKKFVWFSVAVTVVFVAFMLVTLMGALAPRAYAQEATQPATGQSTTTTTGGLNPAAHGMALLSASIVMCVSCVAAGVAVGMTGSAAIGAVAERPELMGRTVLIVGLAEGIAIYGLIIAIMILGKV